MVPEPTCLHIQPCCLKLEWALCRLLIRVVSYSSPIPAWGSPSWVTKGFGSMINSPEKLKVSSWSSIHSDHHCPQDHSKSGNWDAHLSMPRVNLGVFGSGSRETEQFPSHQRAMLASSTSPLGSPLSGLRCLNQSLGRDLLLAPDGFCFRLLAKENSVNHKNLATLLRLAFWEKATLYFKPPSIIKTGLKITSESAAYHLSWQRFVAFFFFKATT